MKVVSSGSIFEIFDDDLKTYNRLPNGVFDVKFQKIVVIFYSNVLTWK